MANILKCIVTNAWLGLFIAAPMCLFLPVTQGHPLDFVSPMGYWGQLAVAFSISVIGPSALPLGTWSAAATRRLNLIEGTLGWLLVRNVFMTTFVFGMVGFAVEIAVGGSGALLERWITLMFDYWPFVYILSIIAEAPAMALTDACLKAFSPSEKLSQQEEACLREEIA